MFEQLSDKLNTTFERLRGRARVSESDLEEALRDVRVALLEADVNFKVVRQLVATVRERALGAKVLESITGAPQVGKIVRDALDEMLGSEATPLVRPERPPTLVVLVGLQRRRRPAPRDCRPPASASRRPTATRAAAQRCRCAP